MHSFKTSCITVSKTDSKECIIDGDTIFNVHIFSDTPQAIDFMGNPEENWWDIPSNL